MYRYSSAHTRPRHQKVVGAQRQSSAALTPERRFGTPRTRGWLELSVGLDGSGKYRPHLCSNPESSSLQRLAIPILSQPHQKNVQDTNPHRRLCISRKPPKSYLRKYKVSYMPFSALTMFVISESTRIAVTDQINKRINIITRNMVATLSFFTRINKIPNAQILLKVRNT